MESLLAKAAAAHALEVEAAAEREVVKLDSQANVARNRFVTLFGLDPEFVQGSVIEHEGLVFKSTIDGLVLLGSCPKCGQTCESTLLHSLESLGYLLAEFKPSFKHVCSGPNAPDLRGQAELMAEAAAEDLDRGDEMRSIATSLISIAESLADLVHLYGG